MPTQSVSELKKDIIELKINKTNKLMNNILVKEKSKQNNLNEKIEIIWNCSNGVNSMNKREFAVKLK